MNNEIAYHEPADPFHMTYYYATDTDLEYDNRWEKLKEGQEEEIHTTHVIVGPEGIAAEVELTPEQGEWVPDKEHYFPHITLALTGEHAPASLGKMMARAKQATWINIEELVEVSRDGQFRRFAIDAWGMAKFEKMEKPRDIAGVNTNHSEADCLLTEVPNSLWTTHPHDVGKIDRCATLTLKPDITKPIWKPQYPLKTEQEEGIAETVEGLLKAGVLQEPGGTRPFYQYQKQGTRGGEWCTI